MIAHIRSETEQQTVLEHLEATATIAEEHGRPLNLSAIMFLTGLFHDFGKETKAFDDYIHKAFTDPRTVHRGEVNHSSAGGKYIYERFEKGDDNSLVTAQLIATAIFSHHGLIDCVDIEGLVKFLHRVDPQREMYYQEALDNNRPLLEGHDVDGLFGRARAEIIQGLGKLRQIAQQMKGRKSDFKFLQGCLQRTISSILIDADRTDTVNYMSGGSMAAKLDIKALWHKFEQNLDKRLAGFNNQSEINRLRERVSQECFDFGNKATGIYCLPIPTGGGKTLCSLRFALRHATKHTKSRIIYIAPFLSILEQNAEEIRTTLDADEYLLEHHSNVVDEGDDHGDNEELDQRRLLTETWDSPIIATTMVQFLNTLFHSKTQSVRRFHQLQDAIIIIDEIQSLPVKCVYMFNVMMNYLAGFCNATVVLCSATQPLLADVEKRILYSEPRDMISNAGELARFFKRVDFYDKTVKGGYETEQLVEFILEKPEDSILVVLNTKGAVRRLYEVLAKRDLENTELVQLTTYMCAQHRSDIIRRLKEKFAKSSAQRTICISTQLIEAGVDISFQCVIRSLAGIDSIMQAAGRCNRNGNDAGTMGRVYLINYNEEYLGSLEDIKIARSVTEDVLREFDKDAAKFENELLSISTMNRYYEEYFWKRQGDMSYTVGTKEEPDLSRTVRLYELLSSNPVGTEAFGYRKNDATTKARWARLPLQQAYRKAGDLFKVIGDNTIGLIVPYGEAKELIAVLRSADVNNENAIRNKALKTALKKLQRFTINVFREDRNFKNICYNGGITMLFDNSVFIIDDDHYDEEVGLSDQLKFKAF
ncbi:MAG: CRISPR-associated helicase Cas3' [Lachnospiraceae bacterium]|jgi:CRISPR-associated endonuclease/helicase Cas3|nr:CRISPR-associated helicase Cas3' [Lachnospiraceae bacterium]